MGSKYGILVHENTFDSANHRRQRETMRIMIEVSKQCEKRGAENIRIADVCSLLTASFDEFGSDIV